MPCSVVADTNISEVHLQPDIEAAWICEMIVSYHNTTWHHNPQDLDLNLYCCESPKSHKTMNYFNISGGNLY